MVTALMCSQGSASSNLINAAAVKPYFLVYRRIAPLPPRRDFFCCHVRDHLQRMQTKKYA